MREKLLRMLSVIGLVLAALASLDMTGITALLPPESAGKALAGGLFIAAIKDFIFAIGDIMDDGKRNGSWLPLVVWLLIPVGVVLLCCPSCVSTTTTTFSPDGTKTVTEYRGPDAASVSAVAGAATVAIQVIAEK